LSSPFIPEPKGWETSGNSTDLSYLLSRYAKANERCFRYLDLIAGKEKLPEN
jgi:hypothetical protein